MGYSIPFSTFSFSSFRFVLVVIFGLQMDPWTPLSSRFGTWSFIIDGRQQVRTSCRWVAGNRWLKRIYTLHPKISEEDYLNDLIAFNYDIFFRWKFEVRELSSHTVCIRSHSLQNVRSWYILSSRLTGFVPYYLQFVGVLSPQYSIRCTTRGNRDRNIPKVDVIIRGTWPRGLALAFSFSASIYK